MRPKAKKYVKQISTAIDEDIHSYIRDLAEEKGRGVSRLANNALRKCIAFGKEFFLN